MRVPLSWLSEFLPIEDFSAEEIAERLSLQSVEAEVSTFGIDLDGVVFGKVLKVKEHPKDKKLLVVKVLVGERTSLNVVTADKTVREGVGVFVAIPNSKVGGKCITRREFDGVVSEGMLLSAQELGLEEASEGVLQIEEDIKPGTDARFVLGFGEKVIELDITPNRGDVLSVRGIARDLGAILNLERREPETKRWEDFGEIEISINDPDCHRYRGVVIRNVEVRPSPLWMRKRLWQCGIRSINNVVDVTNYVLLQEGQPLHAFDLEKLSGGIVVRSARKGEKIKTLDGVERELDEEILVIADRDKPVAVAGVIGGQESSVSLKTTNILLESAYFDPRRVRKSSKKLGVQTESSYRFERNVDIERVDKAQDIAVDLILRVAGGEVVAVRDVYVRRYTPKKIFLSLGKYMRYAGEPYDKEEASRILSALEIPHEIKRCGIEVLVPSHRSFDIGRDVDIIEEIMRVKGYDSFPSEILSLPSVGRLWRDKLLEVRKYLRDKGLNEVINISYEDRDLYELLTLEEPKVEILNPLVPTQKYMRSSLIPSLLRTALFNESHYNYDLGIFEVGRVFSQEGEEERLGILVKGKIRDFPYAEWDPYRLSEILQGLFSLFGRDVDMEPSEIPFLHPHVQSRFLLEGEEIGFIGKLHPELISKLELRREAYICELKLAPLLEDRLPHYEPVSRFPPVIRDLALLVDKNLPVSKLLNEIKSQLAEKVEEVMVFDLYAGEKVGEGKKSVGVRVVFRSRRGSLSSEEVNSLVEELVRRLRDRLGAEIR